MKSPILFASVTLILAMLNLQTVRAEAFPKVYNPPLVRWVQVDDLRVRYGPGTAYDQATILPRGTELLVTEERDNGFCEVMGKEHYRQGYYVACKYLSSERIPETRAGVNNIDAAQRWVSGNSVTVREAPQIDAKIINRLSLNNIVKIHGVQNESGYCKIEMADGTQGFTACRYLVTAPVVLPIVYSYIGLYDGSTMPDDYDPERLFWLNPSWFALLAYADYLSKRYPEIPKDGPWPRNETLERMKAHLKLGLKGKKPKPYLDWLQIKRKAQNQKNANELERSIGIFSYLEDDNTPSNPDRPQRSIALIQELEFASVNPSFFRSESEVAPPATTTEDASGRFDITFRQLIQPRRRANKDLEFTDPGIYDIRSGTQVLVKSVQHIRLFRDGRWQSEPSLIRTTEVLWGEVDPPMCGDWEPGFNFGSSVEPSIWGYFGDKDYQNQYIRMNSNPPGSLYVFYTTMELPKGSATRTEMPVKMDRKATGFVRGIYLYYDLDHDGIPDLAIWEGQGKGPGHLEGRTKTDDRWYRLVLVNINGVWKVLGSDMFNYGCGC